jgi:acetoin utilization deacetylase AcuC-like enzyme
MHKTGLVLDDCFREHDTGPGHPERPQRLVAIAEALAGAKLIDRCARLPLREAEFEQVHRIHSPEYVARVEQTCRNGASYIDTPDSAICPTSYRLALLAAGSVLEAVDQVMAGEIDNAFCAVRPPGHHALRNLSMGFCLLNNTAIAAEYLTHHHKLERVMILDWDVHHANGTQASFEDRRDVLLISLHGHPSWVYPGTSGWATETGVGDGEGYTLNLPMMPGAGDAEYRRAFIEKILPTVAAYQPQFVLVSAGFDAHRDDPLAPIELKDESFDRMTRRVMNQAARYAGGRLVSVLEGGYNLDALGRCVRSHVAHLLNYAPETRALEHKSGVW